MNRTCKFCGQPLSHWNAGSDCGSCEGSLRDREKGRRRISYPTPSKEKDWSELTEEEWNLRCGAMGGYSPYPGRK